MKKAVAVIVSICFYISVFLTAAEVMFSTGERRLYIYGFPVLVVLYFIVMSRVFEEQLQLNPWVMWLAYNIAGYLLCWVALTIRNPMLWFNLGMVVVMIFPTIVLVGLWIVTAIGYWVLTFIKRIQNK